MTADVLSAVRRLAAAETPTEVYSATVAAADDLLESDVNEIATVEGDALIVQARSTHPSETSRRSYPLDVSIPGAAFSSGKSCLIEDCCDTRSSMDTQDSATDDPTEFRSLLCVPISDQGVFIAKTAAPGALTEMDRETAEQLVSHSEAALDRPRPSAKPLFRNGGAHPNRGRPERLEEIAQILSHDVKSPLNVAQGSLELAKQTDEEKHWDRAAASLSRVEEIIDSVVQLARTGEQIDALEPVELKPHVKRAWETLPSDQATLEIDDSTTIRADEQGLCQLLENIFENAITHAGPNVTVTVGTCEDGFYIQDDGPGIPSEHQEAIFERGYSLADGHTGLGLSISYQLAQAHGWTLSLNDDVEDGARFEVRGVEQE